jgi:hypothetical protein
MAKKAKKPGGKFRGFGGFFIVLGIIFTLPALLVTIIGGALSIQSFGFKSEMTALKSFDELAVESYYTADLIELIKFGEDVYAVGVGNYTYPVEFYYIKAHDLANNYRYLVIEAAMPETLTAAKTIDEANRTGVALPFDMALKITGILDPLPPIQRDALYAAMVDAGVVADEAEFDEIVLPYMLTEMPVDYALYFAIAGVVILMIGIIFFVIAGIMFRKSRKAIEAADVEAAKKMDLSKIKQPDSEKFFSNEEDIDSLVAETPTFTPKKAEEKPDDEGSYKPKLPTPTAQAAPDDLDLSNLDFSSLKPPEEDDPLF